MKWTAIGIVGGLLGCSGAVKLSGSDSESPPPSMSSQTAAEPPREDSMDANPVEPYFQKLISDLLGIWEAPTGPQETDRAVGCLRFSADGRIANTLLKEQDDSRLSKSVERALAAFQQMHNETPSPVPHHLLKAVTSKWVCFKLTPQTPEE